MENKFDVKYQFTKVASDLYNVYDSSSNTGEFLNTKSLCDTLIQKRGGVALTPEIYEMLEGAENGHTFGITESALTINKSAKFHGIEPWKLSEVNGEQVFVAASTGCEVDEEKKVKKTASLHSKKHTFKVAIHTGTLEKTARVHSILKSSGYTDEDMYINPANPDTVVLTIEDDKKPSVIKNDLKNKINEGYANICDNDIDCCHDYCDCGEELFDFPDMREGEFVLIIPNVKPMMSTNVDTLKEYAIANSYPTFKVCASDGSTVYDTAMKEAIKEIDESMPQNQKTAEQDVFQDTNTGEVFTEEQLKADPNKNRTLQQKKLNAEEILNMFKEASVIELSTSDKNLLLAALNYCGFEKVAYLSDDAFSIKAGEAVVTVDNNKATYLPLSIFDDIDCLEKSVKKEETESDSILG